MRTLASLLLLVVLLLGGCSFLVDLHDEEPYTGILPIDPHNEGQGGDA
ncbi:hypothetical protein IT575_04985 [bacterium]|nr:hypothetical protein [bacterium]